MKDLVSFQPQIAELLDKLMAEAKASDYAVGLGALADNTGAQMAPVVASALLIRNPRTQEGYDDNWKNMITGYFWIAVMYGYVNQDDQRACINKLFQLCENYCAHVV